MTANRSRVAAIFVSLLVLISVVPIRVLGDEGMFLPDTLNDLPLKKLQQMGLQIPLTDIYNASGPSIKDAVVIVDGGTGGQLYVGPHDIAGSLAWIEWTALYDAVRRNPPAGWNFINDSNSGDVPLSTQGSAPVEFATNGARFLNAVTLGYDIGTRVVMAMGGAAFSYESSLSTHSIAGTFGAAAAAVCAAGLDARQIRWALDYAAQQSSGIIAWRRDTDHIEKAFVFAGKPARSGVTAALVVRAGWNGVDDIFSGADNFFAAYAPKADPKRLIDALGQRYEIAETDIKKWTVGSPIQAPLDAVAAIRDQRPFEADQVQRVTVRLAPSVAAVVDNRDIPDICLQHMLAVMLLDKTVSFAAAHDKPRMQDAAALRERAKINLVRDEELAKLLPVRVAIVEIEFADGTRLSERVTAVRGTPRNPMSRTEVIEKARDLIVPVIGRDASERLIQTVLAIEDVANIRDLRPLLQRADQ